MIGTREKNWQSPVAVQVPTPVLALACDARTIWVGGVGGVAWSSAGAAWQTRGSGLPLTGVAALVSHQDLLLAGGSEGVAYSQDGGRTWQASALQEGLASVTALVVSPRFAQDGTALVATLESGILRSTDQARTWHSASFGLSCFEVSALLWVDGQTVLAATPRGLYRSTNAGRAWKASTTCADTPIAALARTSEGTLLAASDHGVLLASHDQGLHWADFCTSPAYAQPTTLSVTPAGALLLGTAERGLLRITNQYAHWETVLPRVSFAMVTQNEVLYAGTDAGLFASADDGRTWKLWPYPPIHDLRHFLAFQDQLLLVGTQTGLVRSCSDGSWQLLHQPAPPLTGVAATASGALFASNEAGLHSSEDGGEHWQTVLADERGRVTHLSFREHGTGWAVSVDGSRVMRTRDGGRSWQDLPAPFGILPVVALVAGEALLLVVTHDPRLNQAHIWFSQNEGDNWVHGLEAITPWPIVASQQDPLAFALGGTVAFRRGDGAWGQSIVGVPGASGGFVRRLLMCGESVLALTTTGIFSTQLEEFEPTWTRLPLKEDAASLLDLVARAEYLYGLFDGGRVALIKVEG